MARMDVEWISGGMKSRHGWTAAVAILVSVALHIAAYLVWSSSPVLYDV